MFKILHRFAKVLVFTVIFSKAYSQYTYPCGGSLLHFHGTNAYVDAEDFSGYEQSITLAAWVRCEVKNPSNMGIMYRHFFVFQGASTQLEWGLVINSRGEFMFRGEIDTSGGKTYEPSTQPQLDSLSSGIVPDSGKFYHVAVTLDQNTFQCNFYINGTVVAGKTMKGGLHWATAAGGNINDVSIGCQSMEYQGNFSTFSYFNGYIDEVFMSPTVITKAQLDTVAMGKDLSMLNNFFFHFNEGTGSTIYSHPGVVYNSLGYGNTGYLNGDIVWVTNVACPPFPISFIDPYPEMVNDNGTLSTDISKINLNRMVVGAATDGLSKVLLVAKTVPNVKVQFLIQGSDNGSLSSLDQSVINQPYVNVISNGEGYAVGVYTAPDGYGSSYPPGGRNLTVWAFSYDNPNDPTAYTLSSKSLQLITPPVILVHGMWSNPFVWISGGFVKALNDAGLNSIFLADYSVDGASTFDPLSQNSIYGRSAVQKAATDALKSYRNNQMVAAQVDVVGHSLGGLMARSFSQQGLSFSNKENYYKGYIHKLITLGTPHKGSPLGPVLYEKNPLVSIGVNNVNKIISIIPLLNYISNPIGLCHRDFNENGTVIQNNLLETPAFYTYPIAGDYLYNVKSILGYTAFSAVLDMISGKTHAQIFHVPNCLNDEPESDIIVPTYSQLGGESKGTIFSGTAHSSPPGSVTETDNPLIQLKVSQLLLSNNLSDFNIGFPKASTIVDDCTSPMVTNKVLDTINTESISRNSAANQGVQIISPSKGLIFQQNSNSNLTLQYQLINGSLPTDAVFMIQGIGWYRAPTNSPYSIIITLPDSLPLGKLNIVLLAKDTTGLLMADTTSIVINPSGFLDSISAFPLRISLDSTFRITSINVAGFYTGGQSYNEANITNSSSGTIYASLKGTSIFKVSPDGIITAASPGIDTLIISNSGKFAKVPVIVDSNYLKAQKYPDTIQFTIPDRTLDNPPFALAATNASGEDIAYTLISGPVSLVNGVVIINGKGTVYIKASSPGNAYFDSAASVIASFVITDALPLTLLNFTGTLNSNNQVNLSWQTEQEINTSHFIVERSADGSNFSSLDNVTASGNSLSTKNYSYIDQQPLQEVNYYRLKMVDADAKFTYSKVIAVNVNDISRLFKIFPNPAKDIVNLSGTNMQQVQIFDITGKIILLKKLTNANQLTVNVSNLSRGTYIIEVKNLKGNSEKRKLLIE